MDRMSAKPVSWETGASGVGAAVAGAAVAAAAATGVAAGAVTGAGEAEPRRMMAMPRTVITTMRRAAVPASTTGRVGGQVKAGIWNDGRREGAGAAGASTSGATGGASAAAG